MVFRTQNPIIHLEIGAVITHNSPNACNYTDQPQFNVVTYIDTNRGRGGPNMLMMTNNTVQRIFHWIKAQTAFICHQHSKEPPQGWSWYLTFTLTFDSLMQLPVLLPDKHACLGMEYKGILTTATSSSKVCAQ